MSKEEVKCVKKGLKQTKRSMEGVKLTDRTDYLIIEQKIDT